MSSSLNIKLSVLWFLLPLPIFLSPSFSLYLEQSAKAGGGTEFMPISFYVLFIFLIDFPKFLRDFLDKNNIALILFLFFCVLAFSSKFLLENSDGNPLLLLVSIIPMLLSYFIGYSSKDYIFKRDKILYYVNLSLFSISLVAFLHIIYSIITLGPVGALIYRGSETVFNLFGIHQRFVYYPTILSLFFILSLYTSSRFRKVFIFILFAAVIMISSREAMLIALTGVFSKIWFEYYYKKNLKVIFYVLMAVLSLFFFVAIYWNNFVDYFEEATFINKFRSLEESGDLSAGRLDVLESIAVEMEKPEFNLWIGMGFSMNLGILGTPHNQYVEVFFRSGVFGLLFFLSFIFISIKRALTNFVTFKDSKHASIVYGFLIVFLAICLLSFNINTPVRAPYTGILFGLLAGFFNRKFDIKSFNNIT